MTMYEGHITETGVIAKRCSFDEFDRPRAPCVDIPKVATASKFCKNECEFFHSLNRTNPMADFIMCGFPNPMRGPNFKPVKAVSK